MRKHTIKKTKNSPRRAIAGQLLRRMLESVACFIGLVSSVFASVSVFISRVYVKECVSI